VTGDGAGTTDPGGLPRGPHSLTREEVAANQRARMIEAMIETVGEKGYTACTVADVCTRAGVSRKTFYQHFANKEDGFLATYDAIAVEGARGVARAFRGARGLPDGVQAAIATLFKQAIARPEALRVMLVEIGPAGPIGIERREQLIAEYERLLRDSLGLPPGPGLIPNPVLRGVVGGLNMVLFVHVRRGEHARLLELVPDLMQWATSYWPAPMSMMTLVDPAPGVLGQDLVGGRAPGTLSLGSGRSKRRGFARGESGVSHSFVVHSQRERILDAVANLTSAHGYAELTVESVAAEAGVSLQAFYEHFSNKEDAFLVAYEIGHDKGLALVEQAYEAQSDWRRGVRSGILTLFRYLASEPAFAHMALVDTIAATERTGERAIKGVTTYAQMLMPGLEETPRRLRPPSVTVDAIAGGLFELCLNHALHGRLRELPAMVPRATYFALAPFIGADAAGAIATEEI
jgi:AcrR family transcriptional regulator